MSPLVSRHGVKDVENSLSGRDREEKRIVVKFVTKNNKIQRETNEHWKNRKWLSWEWADSHLGSEYLQAEWEGCSYFEWELPFFFLRHSVIV